MDFYALLDQVIDLLRQRGRFTYRALKLQFKLDDEHLEVLKDELIKAQRMAVDENGDVLVWSGGASMPPESVAAPLPHQEGPQTAPPTQLPSPPGDHAHPMQNAASSPSCSATW
jgi:hypothetical protein